MDTIEAAKEKKARYAARLGEPSLTSTDETGADRGSAGLRPPKQARADDGRDVVRGGRHGAVRPVRPLRQVARRDELRARDVRCDLFWVSREQRPSRHGGMRADQEVGEDRF